MKHLFISAVCLLFAAYASAQTRVNKMVVEKVMKESSSTNAHEKGVIKIKLTVDASFHDVDADNKPIEKECPVVRIAPNTLLASRACIDLSGKGTLLENQGSAGIKTTEGVDVSRWIESIQVNGVTLGKDKFRQNDLFIVIAVDGNNDKLKEAVQKMPITDLFVAQNAETLKTVFPKVTLNRDDKLFSKRECANVEVVNVCTEKQCFQLCWKFIDGKTGDPVFGRNPDTDNFEYLLGFNVQNSKQEKRQSSRWYHFLSKSSLDFFKTNLADKEWKYIQAHAKDETLYN